MDDFADYLNQTFCKMFDARKKKTSNPDVFKDVYEEIVAQYPRGGVYKGYQPFRAGGKWVSSLTTTAAKKAQREPVITDAGNNIKARDSIKKWVETSQSQAHMRTPADYTEGRSPPGPRGKVVTSSQKKRSRPASDDTTNKRSKLQQSQPEPEESGEGSEESDHEDMVSVRSNRSEEDNPRVQASQMRHSQASPQKLMQRSASVRGREESRQSRTPRPGSSQKRQASPERQRRTPREDSYQKRRQSQSSPPEVHRMIPRENSSPVRRQTEEEDLNREDYRYFQASQYQASQQREQRQQSQAQALDSEQEDDENDPMAASPNRGEKPKPAEVIPLTNSAKRRLIWSVPAPSRESDKESEESDHEVHGILPQTRQSNPTFMDLRESGALIPSEHGSYEEPEWREESDFATAPESANDESEGGTTQTKKKTKGKKPSAPRRVYHRDVAAAVQDPGSGDDMFPEAAGNGTKKKLGVPTDDKLGDLHEKMSSMMGLLQTLSVDQNGISKRLAGLKHIKQKVDEVDLRMGQLLTEKTSAEVELEFSYEARRQCSSMQQLHDNFADEKFRVWAAESAIGTPLKDLNGVTFDFHMTVAWQENITMPDSGGPINKRLPANFVAWMQVLHRMVHRKDEKDFDVVLYNARFSQFVTVSTICDLIL